MNPFAGDISFHDLIDTVRGLGYRIVTPKSS